MTTPWEAAAELARQAHHNVAATQGGREYYRSRDAFIAVIAAAYPTVDKHGVYGLWVDCMESVAYCADRYAGMDRETQRKFQSIGGAFS